MRMPGAVVLVVAAAIGPVSSVHAQWDPGATRQLGMGHGQNAMSQSALRNATDIASDDNTVRGYAGSGLSRRERLLALEAEYLVRLERDGVDVANAWAFDMGRRDARAR